MTCLPVIAATLCAAVPTETIELRGQLVHAARNKTPCARTNVLLRQNDGWSIATVTDRRGRFTLTYNVGTRPESGEPVNLFYLYAIRPSGDTALLDSFAAFPTGAIMQNDTEPVRATFYLRVQHNSRF